MMSHQHIPPIVVGCRIQRLAAGALAGHGDDENPGEVVVPLVSDGAVHRILRRPKGPYIGPLVHRTALWPAPVTYTPLSS